MEERNFWLLLSVVIIALSGVLILVVGYIYFVVVPRPKISTITPLMVPTNTPTAAAAQITAADPTNTPFYLDIITSTPSLTADPGGTEIPSGTIAPTDTVEPTSTPPLAPSETGQPPPGNPTSLPNYGSPGEFLRSYYALINKREYNATFNMLSDNFKDRFHCCNPDGSYQIQPYIDWWNTIDEVEVYSVKTTPRSENSALATVRLIYHRADGSVVENTHYYDLIFDRASDSWLID